jgi:hypothetical protein
MIDVVVASLSHFARKKTFTCGNRRLQLKEEKKK